MEIVAIGNALMDVISFVDGDFAPSLGFHNNSTVHMASERLAALLPCFPEPCFEAGGGAANTARAASLLGLETSFAGTIGDDPAGERYRADLEGAGVRTELATVPGSTGLFCALIAPHGGRTLLVAPGAAPEISRIGVELQRRSGALLYMDGFLLFNTEFFESEARKARKAGMLVAIDLGSLGLVMTLRDFLLDAIPRYCDFVFANEDEFVALSGEPAAEGLARLGQGDCGFVVKKGERGAFYAKNGRIYESPVRAQRPLDETGAGDAFAAGFLAGLARGLPPERCLRLGNRIAEEVIAVPGLGIAASRVEAAEMSVAR